MQADEVLAAKFPSLSQTDITINANGHSLDGNATNNYRIETTAAQNMTFNDFGSYTKTLADSTTDGAILFADGNYYTLTVTNGGLTNFSNSTTNNTTVLNNAGTVNINNSVISRQ